MENLTALETVTLFGISREAVRKYCLEFDLYLSPIARPQKGRQRMFTTDDLEIIACIVELKGQGKLFTDIHAALANGMRGSVPELPSTITPTPNAQLALQTRLVELETENRLLTKQNAELQIEIRKLEREIGGLLRGQG